jgi:hypothetical protein
MSKAKNTLGGEWRYGVKRLLSVSGGVLVQHNLGQVQLEPRLRTDLIETRGELLKLFEREREDARIAIELAQAEFEALRSETEALEAPYVPSNKPQQLQLELSDPGVAQADGLPIHYDPTPEIGSLAQWWHCNRKMGCPGRSVRLQLTAYCMACHLSRTGERLESAPSVEIIGDTGEFPAVEGPAPDPRLTPVQVDLPEPTLDQKIAQRIFDLVDAGGIIDERPLVVHLAQEFGMEPEDIDLVWDELTEARLEFKGEPCNLEWNGTAWTVVREAAQKQAETTEYERKREAVWSRMRELLEEGKTKPQVIKQLAKETGQAQTAIEQTWWPPARVEKRGKYWVVLEEATDEAVQAALLEGVRTRGNSMVLVWTDLQNRFGLSGLQLGEQLDQLVSAGLVVFDPETSTYREVGEPAGVV